MQQMSLAPAGILARADAAVPDGSRVYAIGDIHGRADLLARMADLIARDCRERPCRDALTVTLGDYIDRGPGSAQVIDRLARGDVPTPLVSLKGNHEELFRQFLGGELSLPHFFRNGGDATLQSYGLDPWALGRGPSRAAARQVMAAMPDAHLSFLDGLRTSVSLGGYFFCHAGARPGVPLDRQDEEDLLWIREDFLRSDHDFGQVIVHGHTPVPEPEVRVNGIDVDTKAFASGTLTALVLDGAERRFLQARA